ncbi:MAG: iron chelate uptake ABC transporter family permease subunit [bacterium]|nr:iron chelate uptake ABC transporter family permease subunit [bacterium]MDD5756207.1 iron chelate uptake ABC transporter family permease subunit [bacterium]
MNKKQVITIILLFLSLLLLGYLSLYWGAVKISPFQAQDEVGRLIMFRLRLPRILLAIIAGFGLSVSGVVFQALLRNPLADPYILGTSSGAALGGVLAIALGLGASIVSISFSAFVFALLTLFIVYKLAQHNGKMPVQNLLLAGVIINTFLSGLVTLIMSLSRQELYSIMFWIMGSLSQADQGTIWLGGSTVLLLSGAIILMSRDLNIMTLGEEKAQSLGVPVELMRKILFVTVSLVIAILVSICGLIGFVGLIIPHISRLLVGPDHKVLLPVSGLLGAIFLLLCDVLARTIAIPLEIPIGVITALAGAPFFLYLLRRKRTNLLLEE